MDNESLKYQRASQGNTILEITYSSMYTLFSFLTF